MIKLKLHSSKVLNAQNTFMSAWTARLHTPHVPLVSEPREENMMEEEEREERDVYVWWGDCERSRAVVS